MTDLPIIDETRDDILAELEDAAEAIRSEYRHVRAADDLA